jgi:hypothetical protein
MMKKYSFFYHYNKPASAAAGRPQLSIHYRGQCHIVDELSCAVPTYSKIRKTQPHIVIAGKATLRVENRKGILE